MKELLAEILPTVGTRVVSVVSIAVGTSAFFLPTILSEQFNLRLEPRAALEMRLGLPMLVFFLGSLIVNVLLLFHVRSINAQFDEAKKKSPSLPPAGATIDPSKRRSIMFPNR